MERKNCKIERVDKVIIQNENERKIRKKNPGTLQSLSRILR